MKTIQVSAKLAGGEPVTVDFDMPENLSEMTSEWGEEGVYNQARQAVIVSLQGRMRTMIKEDRKGGPASDEELQKMADEFEIGTRKPAKSKAEKIKETFAQLDPELKKQLIAEMRAQQDAPAAKPAARNGGQKTTAKTAPPAAKTAAKTTTGTRPAAPTQGTRPAQPQGVKRPTGPVRR